MVSFETRASSKAAIALRAGHLSTEGFAYLDGWAKGVLPRAPLPASYSLLEHRGERDQAPRPLPEVVPTRPMKVKLKVFHVCCACTVKFEQSGARA